MIEVISTNITSPLGFTTEENYQAVLSGSSALKRYEGLWGLPEPFAASLFSEKQRRVLAIEGYTFFEAIAIQSIREALTHISIDVASPRVVFILSTTKGNIEESPYDAAQRIAEAIGLVTKPIVVCNACVSGLSAQLLASHLLSAGFYDYAIVVGAEVQSKFIVSGFQSLKAVSEEPCRPFDIERNGLNPGEAAATIIIKAPSCSPFGGVSKLANIRLQRALPQRGQLPVGSGAIGELATEAREGAWHLISFSTCNDAYHIVSPSPQGEGCFKAIETAMKGWEKSRLATVCVHGTATLYNDQMESKAIERAGLSDVPLSALKGYYGHTMGAAGVLETILTMRATDDGIVLGSKGFTEVGVSGKVSISNASQKTDKTSFLKIMSGFGGNNVAALYAKDPPTPFRGSNERWTKTHTVKLSSKDGKSLTDIYKQEIGDYPKFYKMDILSQLAFVTAEKTLSNFFPPSLMLPNCSATNGQLPLKGENSGKEVSPLWGDLEGSLILFNHSSSIVADRAYLSTISDPENFFPSPSLFVYTLPNITTGEIAIRHHFQGETSFYILPEKDEAQMQQILEATLRATGAKRAISGWIDAESETNFECELSIYNIHN